MDLFYQILEQYPRGLNGQGWDIIKLCYNPNFPMEFAIEHPEGIYCINDQGELILMKWRWDMFSKRDKQDWSFIARYPELPWSWNDLSKNRNLPWDLVREHPEFPWSWNDLSKRSDLPWDLVREHPDKSWYWFELSYHNHLDWNLARNHPEFPWRWDIISVREDLDKEFVEANPILPWHGKLRITPLQEVMMELDEWTPKELSRLNFDGHLPGSKTKSSKRLE